MKVIKKINIQNHVAKLILLNNGYVMIKCDDDIISTSEKVWENIKDDEWAQSALLELEVSTYINRIETRNKLEKLAEEYF